MVEVVCFRITGKDPKRMMQDVRKVDSELIVQAVKDTGITNEFYYKMIAFQTLRAMATENLIAKKPEIDLLLRLAGTTQIAQALAKSGARESKAFILVVAGKNKVVESLTVKRTWTRLARLPLSEKELASIEEAALLNARRG